MKYDVVEAETLFVLIQKVNALIEEGWEPQGGISTIAIHIAYSLNYKYSQAMIKRD